MQTYAKLPLDIKSQIAILKDRGLVFLDENQAIKKLKLISYFRMANYWKPMEADKVLHRFKPNSTFENALSLYTFDKELRVLLFSAIQNIEIALRTKIIQHVSLRYGSFWFSDSSLFNKNSIFEKCLSNIKDEIRRSKEDFIVEHFRKYDNPPYPPSWKALEVSSFGTLSKLYCNLSDVKLKKKIAKEFGLPQHIYFESWIKSLSVLRNCTAHHNRLWNRKFALKPQLPNHLSGDWINIGSVSREKLYAQVSCIAYMLDSIDLGDSFKNTFKDLLSKYPNADPFAMGFPLDWKQTELWK